MEYYDERDWYPELEGLKVEIDLDKSEIRKFYAGATLFITGGAGFLGGLLIEKIARSCPNFGKIYLLLRPKRGYSPAQRLEKMFDDEVFDSLKKENPGFISKVFLLEGDLGEPMCGLSQENQKIIREEVNLVFHIAACLRMAEPLMTAYTMNVRATKDLLDLATTMKQLKGFVYVSTAYSNCFRPDISEKFYEPTYSWKDLQDLAEAGSEDQLSSLTPKIIGPWVNTYAFTKAVAEDMVKMYIGKIPVAIARPSIVIGCANEPKKNWINNVYGVTGVAVAGCVGIMRVWYGNGNKVADIIPADYVINTMIAIPWQIYRQFEAKEWAESPIFNVVSSPKAPTTWGEYSSLSAEGALKSETTTKKSIGEYFCILCKHKSLWYLLFYMFHLTQGLFFDTALWLKGKKPRLLNAYQKIMRFNLHLSFFCEREWQYEQPNVDKLIQEMNEDDKKLFPFDMTNFDWRDYHLTTVRAIYRYILKSYEDVEDPTEAARRYYMFVNARMIIIGALETVLFYFFVKLSGRAVLQMYLQCT